MGEKNDECRTLVVTAEGNKPLARPRNGRIILKWILNRMG
jgi:hypothetical protein